MIILSTRTCDIAGKSGRHA